LTFDGVRIRDRKLWRIIIDSANFLLIITILNTHSTRQTGTRLATELQNVEIRNVVATQKLNNLKVYWEVKTTRITIVKSLRVSPTALQRSETQTREEYRSEGLR